MGSFTFFVNSARIENRDALDAAAAGVFASVPRERMIERLDEARIAYGRLGAVEDLADHPQSRLVTIRTDGGPVEVIAPGALVPGDAPTDADVPGLGAHDDAIRAEFGSG